MTWVDYLPFPVGLATSAVKAGAEAVAKSDAVASLKQQARAWAVKVVELHNTKVPAQYAAQKQDLLNRAKTIKNAVEKIFGSMPELSSMNLGVVPLIAVGAAAVAAAAALIAKWTLDYASLKANLTQYSKMVKDGVNPTTAAVLTTNAATVAKSNTISGSIAKVVPFVVVGGLVFAFKDKIFG